MNIIRAAQNMKRFSTRAVTPVSYNRAHVDDLSLLAEQIWSRVAALSGFFHLY